MTKAKSKPSLDECVEALARIVAAVQFKRVYLISSRPQRIF